MNAHLGYGLGGLFAVVGLLSVSSACSDDGFGASDGETGQFTTGMDLGGGIDVPDPEPFDPFGGEGSRPPGDPDRNAAWSSPSLLGNGMVHDSRYDLKATEASATFSAAQLAAGVDWANSFVTSHHTKITVGFRPTQVGANVSLTPNGGNFDLKLTDRSVYISDDDANYRTETKTYVFSGLAAEQALSDARSSAKDAPRPTSIDTFTANGNEFGVHIVWTYDNNPVPWRMVAGMNEGNFVALVDSLRQQNIRPISISSRRRNGRSEYAAIFVEDGLAAPQWQSMIGHDAEALATEMPLAWAEGFYPFQRTAEFGSDANPRFNLIWIKRPPSFVLEARHDLDATLFEAEDIARRQQGYHLESAYTFSIGGAERFGGLWVRYTPYLRWQGTVFEPDDPTYIARYKPFHDQAIQVMNFAGQPSEGQVFRSASTLHLFEGDKLVLSRAYTFGPAIHSLTPINASMGLASVSKSITAAMVVREMNLKGLSLDTPFAAAAGINNVPAMATTPSVRDVLRMRGGFSVRADSYLNHSLIDASIYGQYPITGTMMYDYVVLGGRLGVDDTDNYWDTTLYSADSFLYSNPGYTMLGELVRVQSGASSYADYVRTNLLVPLNLHEGNQITPHKTIYPDPTHRNARNLPTKLGRRSYLISSGHPYISSGPGCTTVADCDYLPFAACGPNGNCTGCSKDSDCEARWICANNECVDSIFPLTQSEEVPQPIWNADSSPRWAANAGAPSISAPATAAIARYGGNFDMGGAPLAAGGWHGDGEALGFLIRAIARFGFSMPKSVAAELWSPEWWAQDHGKGVGWSYGLGWYARGNWVAMAGGTDGAMGTAVHNSEHDFTVVHLANLTGNGLSDFLHPLLFSATGVWSASENPRSILGGQFPCKDDELTPLDECGALPGAAY